MKLIDSMLGPRSNKCTQWVVPLAIIVSILSACTSEKESFMNDAMQLAIDGNIDEQEWGKIKDLFNEDRSILETEGSEISDEQLREILREHASNLDTPITHLTIYEKPIVTIDSIRFYLETSGSMGGYFQPKFDQFTTNAFRFFNVDEDRTALYTIDASIEEDRSSKDEFETKMSSSKFEFGAATPLMEIFDAIAQDIPDQEVRVLLSDGIMSYSEEEIDQSPDRDLNLAAIELLEERIRDTFEELHDSGFAVVMYGYMGEFRGKYFNYRNKPVYIDTKERPYYLWCIGKPEVLKIFTKELESDPVFDHSCKNLMLGFESTELPFFGLCKDYGLLGDWGPSSDIQDIVVSGGVGEPFGFGLAIDLSDLGPDIATNEYLKTNLKVEYDDTWYAPIEVVSAKKIKHEMRSPDDEELAKKTTHIFKFKLPELYDSEGMVKIELERAQNDWVGEWSIPNDLVVLEDQNNINGKTWMLEKLVRAMKNGFSAHEQKYLDMTINITSD